MKFLVLLGRILFGGVFIVSAPGHFGHDMIQSAANHNVPIPSLLVPLSGIIALLGGLSIILGFKARLGAWLLILFLVPVTLFMHNFWAVLDPSIAEMQQMMFMKNLTVLGGALVIAYFGAGPLSVDERSGAYVDEIPEPAGKPAAAHS
jgi:putative oxidoreductase